MIEKNGRSSFGRRLSFAVALVKADLDMVLGVKGLGKFGFDEVWIREYGGQVAAAANHVGYVEFFIGMGCDSSKVLLAAGRCDHVDVYLHAIGLGCEVNWEVVDVVMRNDSVKCAIHLIEYWKKFVDTDRDSMWGFKGEALRSGSLECYKMIDYAYRATGRDIKTLIASSNPKNLQLLKFLVEVENVTLKESYLIVASTGSPEMFKYVFEKAYNPNGKNILEAVISEVRTENLRWLLDQGFSSEHVVELAVRKNRREIFYILHEEYNHPLTAQCYRELENSLSHELQRTQLLTPYKLPPTPRLLPDLKATTNRQQNHLH